MKLEVTPIEAILLSFGFASMFVISLYIWNIFEGKYVTNCFIIFRRAKTFVYNENSTIEITKRITSVRIISLLR